MKWMLRTKVERTQVIGTEPYTVFEYGYEFSNNLEHPHPVNDDEMGSLVRWGWEAALRVWEKECPDHILVRIYPMKSGYSKIFLQVQGVVSVPDRIEFTTRYGG